MVVILALEIVALRSRGLLQWAGPDAGVKSAKRPAHQVASTDVAHGSVYHRIGDCHATQISVRARSEMEISV
jgi:hypothetical protein